MQIVQPGQTIQLSSGKLTGNAVKETVRTIADLADIFVDKAALETLNQSQIAYRVEFHRSVKEGTAGGLFLGTTYLEPGLVGQEYLMTKGHFHVQREKAEYYWCIQGKGVLIFMNEQRQTWGEAMCSGSLHYIPGRTAHRLANVGETTLVVGACWPSDAGHDYETITHRGFSARLFCIGNKPTLVRVREIDDSSRA